MSDDDLFIDNGPSRPKNVGTPGGEPVQPARSAAPKADKTDKAFDPFADMAVQKDPLATQAPPPQAPSDGPAPAPVISEPEEDVVPGSAKDLWPCPHCGARNKPGRDSCRSCGKSPDDDVAKPWFTRPPVIGAIAVVVVILVLVIVMSGGGPVTLMPATIATLGSGMQTGAATKQQYTLADGSTMKTDGRISLVGYLSATGNTLRAGETWITLAILLDTDATNSDRHNDLVADMEQCDLFINGVPANAEFAFLHVRDEQGLLANAPAGSIISIIGDELAMDNVNWGRTLKDREHVIVLQGVNTGSL